MEAEDPAYLLAQAERCRRLVNTTCDERMLTALIDMAEDYEARAARAVKPVSGPPS